MIKKFDTYVRDGERRVPVSADEEKTLIWAGWHREGDPAPKSKKPTSSEELPTYDSPPVVPSADGK